jgi:preprotein translocase subunit SecD
MKEQRIKSGKTLRKQLKHPIAGEVLCHQLQMNVTHILTGAVLFIFGSGPLRVSDYINRYHNVIIYFYR